MPTVGVRRFELSPDLLVGSVRSVTLGGAEPGELTDGCLLVMLPLAFGA